MFSTRLFVLIGALALVTMALLTFQAGGTSSAIDAWRGSDLTDYALRHRELLAQSKVTGASDWFERHSELKTALTADLSDYYIRHRDTLNVAASDWYERHRSSQ